MERAISLASSFIYMASEKGHKVGLAANCALDNGERKLSFPISAGRYHALEILRALASARINHASSFSALVETGMKRNVALAEVLVISAVADDAFSDALSLLRRRNSVEVIMI